MKFFTAKNLPKDIENNSEPSDPSYMDQIHEMVKNGRSVEEIHKAIDGHPDMYSKDAFKEYAKHIHKPMTEHYGIVKSSDENS